jgi:hypothetical protein
VFEVSRFPGARPAAAWRAWATSAIGVALIALASSAPAAAADPVFVLHQPVTHTLSPRGENLIPLLLSSVQPVTEFRVTIIQIKTPRGQLLPATLFEVGKLPSALGPEGSPFTLKVTDASLFKESGDYTATIRLTGVQNNVAQAQLLSLTITVPPPTLDVTRHQGSTLRVRRWTPWSAAVLDQPVRFEETGGRSNVADLRVSAQDVFVKGTTERAQASVTLAADDLGDGGSARTLPASGQREIRLVGSGLDHAGTFTTGLLLTSPTLTAALLVPFQIEVVDRWPIPLLVIFLGVIIGAWVRHLSQVTRPREVARFRRTLLAGQVARFRERSRDLQQVQELDRIDDLLRRSDERLQLGELAAATTLLDEAEAALAAFRKTSEEQFRAVVRKLRDATSKADELTDRIPPTETADRARLETARQHLAAAGQALATFDVPAADTRIVSAITIVDALSTVHPVPAQRRGLAPGRARAITITVGEAPEDRVAGQELRFEIEDPATLIRQDDTFEWDFGDGARLATTSPNVGHRFQAAGGYRVRVAIMRAGAETASDVVTVDVLPRHIELIAAEQARSLWRVAAVLTLVSLVIATLTGLGLFFLGKSFGTPQQYLEAFLWGFGIDSAVKNVAEVMKKV